MEGRVGGELKMKNLKLKIIPHLHCHPKATTEGSAKLLNVEDSLHSLRKTLQE